MTLILQLTKSPMAALDSSLLMAMPCTLLEDYCYMLRNMEFMSFASLHILHMHCKVSSVRIFQKQDLMGFNSLGCSGILPIQAVLSSRMEERAQYNAGKMTKSEFLEAISGPYQHAFTPENIKRAFEMTGTWPIDRTKITAEATAPSEGLSFKSSPIVSLNSPVKKLVQAFDNHAHWNTSARLPSPSSGLPSPSSQDSDLPPSIPPSLSTESLYSIIHILSDTHARFLFYGSPASSRYCV